MKSNKSRLIKTTKILLFSLMLSLLQENENNKELINTEIVTENDNYLSISNNSISNVKNLNEEKKRVALTFDDGPSKYTNLLLDILSDNNSKATFFILGDRINLYEDSIKKIIDNGNQIGIHGFTHKNFKKMNIKSLKQEIDSTNDLLNDIGIEDTNLVRPPYGAINDEIKENLDCSFIMWDIDPEDWNNKSKDEIVVYLKNNIKENSIILLHDINEETVQAIPEILENLSDEFEFVTINELFKNNNQILENNEIYYNAKVKK